MKKIVLLGDSIRMGYDKYVKEALAGSAEVLYPKENCKFALNILRCIVEWKRDGGWGDDVDLVHWNAGLWDCVEVDGDDPLTPLAWYEETVARVDKRLRAFFPKAKIIFATSTSVAICAVITPSSRNIMPPLCARLHRPIPLLTISIRSQKRSLHPTAVMPRISIPTRAPRRSAAEFFP